MSCVCNWHFPNSHLFFPPRLLFVSPIHQNNTEGMLPSAPVKYFLKKVIFLAVRFLIFVKNVPIFQFLIIVQTVVCISHARQKDLCGSSEIGTFPGTMQTPMSVIPLGTIPQVRRQRSCPLAWLPSVWGAHTDPAGVTSGSLRKCSVQRYSSCLRRPLLLYGKRHREKENKCLPHIFIESWPRIPQQKRTSVIHFILCIPLGASTASLPVHPSS